MEAWTLGIQRKEIERNLVEIERSWRKIKVYRLPKNCNKKEFVGRERIYRKMKFVEIGKSCLGFFFQKINCNSIYEVKRKRSLDNKRFNINFQFEFIMTLSQNNPTSTPSIHAYKTPELNSNYTFRTLWKPRPHPRDNL